MLQSGDKSFTVKKGTDMATISVSNPITVFKKESYHKDFKIKDNSNVTSAKVGEVEKKTTA